MSGTQPARNSTLLAKNAAHNGRECPFCGEREGIDWNGIKGRDCGYACNGGNGCGQQWDAQDYRPTDEEMGR
jgi:hypothetical protein